MFAIRQTRHFYGPRTEKSPLIDEAGRELRFATLAAAQTHIEALQEERYYLSHNESGRPDYKIVTVK